VAENLEIGAAKLERLRAFFPRHSDGDATDSRRSRRAKGVDEASVSTSTSAIQGCKFTGCKQWRLANRASRIPSTNLNPANGEYQ
jgi:hypothetical protein